MAKPKVSVVVPIYKVQNYLMQCIDSILSQTLQEIEVILVDEGDIDDGEDEGFSHGVIEM